MSTQHPTPTCAELCARATKGPRIVDAVMGEHPLEICLANPPPEQGNPVVIAATFVDNDDDPFITVEQARANAQLIARLSPEVVMEIYRALQCTHARLVHLESIEDAESPMTKATVIAALNLLDGIAPKRKIIL